MIQISNILDFLNTCCPFELAEDWDNCGLNVGRHNSEVKKILLAMDVTDESIDTAKKLGCDLLLTHHPLLFDAPKQINDSSFNGRYILKLAESGIAHIACHTNLDAAEGGINDILASLCDMQEKEHFEGLGRMGKIPHTATALAALLKERLPAKTCLGVLDHETIGKAAIVGGSGGSLLEDAYNAGCDTFITGEAKHHHALQARDLQMNLLVFGHYETEYIVLSPLKEALNEAFPQVECFVLPYKAAMEQL